MTPSSPEPSKRFARINLADVPRSTWVMTLPVLIFLVLVPVVVGFACNFKTPAFLTAITPGPTPSNTAPSVAEMGIADWDASTTQDLPETQLTFRVRAPENTPAEGPLFLTLLDEVTGLALHATSYEMSPVADAGGQVYEVTLPFRLGSLVRYRYERQSAGVKVGEHGSNGVQVRYRLYHVEGPGRVEDVISRWTDTPFAAPTGRIMGRAYDAATGQSLPNLLVTAGGAATWTTSDGTFLLEGLPPGTHNLVAVSLDGVYRTFQQGATVAAESTTPADIRLTPAPLVDVVFVVRLPEDTPPLVPVRLAGSLFQTGNTFADLAGGINSLATNMPVLEAAPDGRHTLTVSLPAGADLRYKYTLGDGFWNAEHSPEGDFVLRQVVVPESNLVVEDTVETWHDSARGPLTFDVTLPDSTPPDDSAAIQFNPLFGWTEPLPMWRLGTNRWAYILYSPLNLPGDLGYRYCRNGQCGAADDSATPGATHAGRRVELKDGAQSLDDQVESWAWLGQAGLPAPAVEADIPARPTGFWTGVEFDDAYRPSWRARLPNMLGEVQSLGGNWLVLTPSWTWTRAKPPVLEPVSGSDPLWLETSAQVEQGRIGNLSVALFPTPRFPEGADAWWQAAPRDYSWWIVWFEHYRTFILHHASLAASSNASALILGGDWLAPALPGGTLSDGLPSGVPDDSDTRWRNLIAEVRSVYNGTLLWAMPFENASNPPALLDSVDGVYVLWSQTLTTQADPTPADMAAEAGLMLDNTLLPFGTQMNKPLILAVSYPSADTALAGCVVNPEGGCYADQVFSQPGVEIPGVTVDLQEQADAYAAMLAAVNQRTWISGFISRGYYPPAALQDLSNSIHGKPAGELLSLWFPRWLGLEPVE